jgi:hypothetical protein
MLMLCMERPWIILCKAKQGSVKLHYFDQPSLAYKSNSKVIVIVDINKSFEVAKKLDNDPRMESKFPCQVQYIHTN